jgi:hypothetical protein
MKKMIALINHRYGVDRISKGDVFNVRDEHVVLWKALGKAKDMPVVGAMSTEGSHELIPTRQVDVNLQRAVVQPKEEVHHENANQTETIAPKQANETAENNETMLENGVQQSVEYSRMLRERATALGIHVDGRWSDTRVQREIDDHNKRTYQHMDMRATE